MAVHAIAGPNTTEDVASTAAMSAAASLRRTVASRGRYRRATTWCSARPGGSRATSASGPRAPWPRARAGTGRSCARHHPRGLNGTTSSRNGYPCGSVASGAHRSTRTSAPPASSERDAASVMATTSRASAVWSLRSPWVEDAPREVPKLRRQRLLRVQLRRDDVACAVRELVLAERLRVRVDDAVVEDPDRLRRAVLVDHHLLAADHDGPPELARRQPAQLDLGHDARREAPASRRLRRRRPDDRVATHRAHRLRYARRASAGGSRSRGGRGPR